MPIDDTGKDSSTSPRVAVVLNPRTVSGPAADLWEASIRQLRSGNVVATLETLGDSSDRGRITRLIDDVHPALVVAVGGDGTVSVVVEAIMWAAAATRPALAIIPLGTANNVARSLGLQSCRGGSQAAVELAVMAAREGSEGAIDVGSVQLDGGVSRFLIGSFAIAMDADILATRNRIRWQLRLGRRVGGYPLYLWSCAVNAVARGHGGAARLIIDGTAVDGHLYNLLVTNTPLYAGEFRFDGDNRADDGRLDLHVFTRALDYLREYPAAWVRHLRYTRGVAVVPPRTLRRFSTLEIGLQRPVSAQIDGEECGEASRYTIRVVPHALRIRRGRAR